MGNKSNGNRVDKTDKYPKEGKWTPSNTKLNKLDVLLAKPYSIDCRVMNENDEKQTEVLVCIASQSGGLHLCKITLLINAKGKISFKYSRINNIPLQSTWVMTCAISPNCKLIASGGLDNLVSVFKFEDRNQYQHRSPFRELQQHQGYISCVKFISDNLLISASGDASLIIWDIERQLPLSYITAANGDIESVDYIHLSNKHIIAFGSIDKNVYIRDITKVINESETGDNISGKWVNFDNDHDDQKVDAEQNDDLLIWSMQLGGFQCDVNSVAFSPNGNYLAATSDDSTYEIYVKNYKYDSFWDAMTLEFTFLCKKNLDIDSIGLCVKWIDNETLMIGCDETNILYCTSIHKQREDPKTIKVINECVLYIIESLPNMNWVGLCETIANEIMQYLCHYNIHDYTYPFVKNKDITRVSCISSCIWSKKYNQSVVVFGCWDKQIRAIIPK